MHIHKWINKVVGRYIGFTWDYYTETGHFPATRIIELFEILDA